MLPAQLEGSALRSPEWGGTLNCSSLLQRKPEERNTLKADKGSLKQVVENWLVRTRC